MFKFFASTAALALCANSFSLALPADNEDSPSSETDTGAVAIVLTTEDGEPTDVAQQGLDTATTTVSSSRLTDILLASLKAWLTPSSQVHSQDSANPLNDEYELFSAPIAIEDPFAVAAMTWQSDTPFPEDATIEMRTLDGEKWSPWYILELTENCSTEVERCGTEYMLSGSSSGIQARISHTDNPLPADLRIDISYSTEGEETIIEAPEITDTLPEDTLPAKDESPNTVLASSVLPLSSQTYKTTTNQQIAIEQKKLDVATTQVDIKQAATKSSIKSRSAWGANESLRTWKPSYVKFEGVIIHHTAGTNSYTKAQVPSAIRGIYRYHAITLGWGDIGYNVLIDKYGERWEGRYGTLSSSKNQMVVGGHAKPRNTGTMGISVMGDYSSIQPSSTVITALTEVAAWKFIEANVNPSSTSPLTIPSETGTMKSQVGKPLNRIVGHKDVYPTACPGKIYNSLTKIRQNVRQLYVDSKKYTRLSGSNAYNTMSAIVSHGFTTTGGTVVIATSQDYYDALSASGIAGLHNAPILFTNPTQLSSQTKKQLTRLNPKQIIITGGEPAISSDVEKEIKTLTKVTPKRYAGPTAMETANEIAKAGKGKWSKNAIVVTSTGYWDGLSIGPYSYMKHAPIFYANGSKILTRNTLDTMKELGITNVYIIGDTVAIPASVEKQITNKKMTFKRIGGTNAINTSQKVAEFCVGQGMKANNMGVATTKSYYDGLAASPLLGKKNSVIVLTNSTNFSAASNFYKKNKSSITHIYIFGDTTAVSQKVVNYLK